MSELRPDGTPKRQYAIGAKLDSTTDASTYDETFKRTIEDMYLHVSQNTDPDYLALVWNARQVHQEKDYQSITVRM